ncbi:MAG: hypothetical protein ACKO2P_00855 [Planctomycetota bacterium]
MSRNPWSPPAVQEDPEPSTPLWRQVFGAIAAGLSVPFAVSAGVLLAMGQYFAVPTSILLAIALWRVGKNLRLNRPVP